MGALSGQHAVAAPPPGSPRARWRETAAPTAARGGRTTNATVTVGWARNTGALTGSQERRGDKLAPPAHAPLVLREQSKCDRDVSCSADARERSCVKVHMRGGTWRASGRGRQGVGAKLAWIWGGQHTRGAARDRAGGWGGILKRVRGALEAAGERAAVAGRAKSRDDDCVYRKWTARAT